MSEKTKKESTKSLYIRLTKQEYDLLCKYSEKCGMPKSAYIRHMLNGTTPKEQPPDEYFTMIRELFTAAGNLNHLIGHFRRTYNFNPTRFFEDYKLFSETLYKIQETVNRTHKKDNNTDAKKPFTAKYVGSVTNSPR